MKNKFFGIIFALALPVFPFDWPQEEVQSDKFFSYFAQLRGGTISNSLVFADTENVKACEEGSLVIELNDENGAFFPSTLGCALVLQHKDNIQTVYGNLDDDSINIETPEKIEAGTILASVTNSGWQEGKSALEFQVIDTKKHNVINPRVLMPRIGKELPLTIRGVTAVSRDGAEIALGIQKNIKSGSYHLYRERQNPAMPFKTEIFVNGALCDAISYGILVSDRSKIAVSGISKNYDLKTLYPDAKRSLLGEVNIPRGKVQIRIAVTDILGAVTNSVYNLEVR